MIISIIVRHPLLEIPSCRSGPKAEREIHLTFLLFGQEQDKSGRTYLCGLLHSALCACANKHPRSTSDCQEGGRGGEYVVVLFQGGRCSLSTDFSMFIKNGRILLINSFCGWMVHVNFSYKTRPATFITTVAEKQRKRLAIPGLTWVFLKGSRLVW